MTENTEKIEKIEKTVVKPVVKPAYIRRRLSPEAIAQDIAPRFTGTLEAVDAEEIYDAKTGRFLSETELKKAGMKFVWIDYDTEVSHRATKKNRTTKEPRTFRIFKRQKYAIASNISWTNWINKRNNDGGFIAGKPTNQIEEALNCKAIGEKDGKWYIKGVIVAYSGEAEYYNEAGTVLDKEDIEKNYMPVKSEASKDKQREKYGLNDGDKIPSFTTTMFSSCKAIRGFGFEYIPTE